MGFPAYSIYVKSHYKSNDLQRRGNTTKRLIQVKSNNAGTRSSIASENDYEFTEGAVELPKSAVLRVPSVNRKQSTSSTNKQLPLKTILASEQLRGEFIELLAKEFALENLLFIESVANYRREWTHDLSKDEVLTKCDEIKRLFLLPNSPNEINAPIKIIKNCLGAIEALRNGNSPVERSRNIFDSAASEISQMLSVNYIHKFMIQRAK